MPVYGASRLGRKSVLLAHAVEGTADIIPDGAGIQLDRAGAGQVELEQDNFDLLGEIFRVSIPQCAIAEIQRDSPHPSVGVGDDYRVRGVRLRFLLAGSGSPIMS